LPSDSFSRSLAKEVQVMVMYLFVLRMYLILILALALLGSWVSIVGIATAYRLDE
jgi:hypothetical protein